MLPFVLSNRECPVRSLQPTTGGSIARSVWYHETKRVPTGFLPNYAAAEIYASLREYARRTRHGYAFTDNIGYLVNLPHRQSFSPDASYYAGQATGMKMIEGVVDPNHPTLFRRGDRADAEPAVSGWSMPVEDLFPYAVDMVPRGE